MFKSGILLLFLLLNEGSEGIKFQIKSCETKECGMKWSSAYLLTQSVLFV
jgi:hypothetical protein